MEPLYVTLRQHPEIALFFTLAIGFYLGRFKIYGCSIGSVTGVLLTGLMIGQINIPISPAIKSVFFLFFLFAVGYGVGPQFFHGLKSEGIRQAIFATLVCGATDALHQLGRSPAERQQEIYSMSIAFAITYIFGTAGASAFLALLGPKILGVNLAAECKALESAMGGDEPDPSVH